MSMLAGTKVFSPGAVAGYALVGGLPLGLLLYGLNVSRRGAHAMGRLLCVTAGISYLMLVAGAAVGADIRLYGFLGIFGAIGLYKFESDAFRKDEKAGAVKARWWPPALLALLAWLLIATVVAVAKAIKQT